MSGTAEEGVARRSDKPLSRDLGDIVDDANRDEATVPRPVTERQ